jgi:hypothetical protein
MKTQRINADGDRADFVGRLARLAEQGAYTVYT